MFKSIIKIITRPTTNSTKVINVINKDIKFNLYLYESVCVLIINTNVYMKSDFLFL